MDWVVRYITRDDPRGSWQPNNTTVREDGPFKKRDAAERHATALATRDVLDITIRAAP